MVITTVKLTWMRPIIAGKDGCFFIAKITDKSYQISYLILKNKNYNYVTQHFINNSMQINICYDDLISIFYSIGP